MKYMTALFFAFVAIIISYTQTAEAHVRYLVDSEEVEANSGLDLQFLFSALTDTKNIGLMMWTIAGAIIVLLLATQVKIFREELKRIRDKANSYSAFIPWMLRLSLGIALIGSGTAMNLISPALPNFPMFSTIQIFLGFMIMAGFLVVPSAIAAVGVYLFAVMTDIYLIGNIDFFAIALALIVLDNERPGVDDLLGIPKISPFHRLQRFVPFILRAGIGIAMMFLAAYEKILNPHLSEIIVNDFGLLNVVPVSVEMWVFSAGIIEFAIGLALLVGFYTRVSATIAFVVLSLSFFYFGEDVSSHITLFGILSVLFVTQGGRFSLDKKLYQTNPDFV
jgi:uncharacterized membrane protein YphA (DoxX/SURF4 family)